jgi:dihydrofolate reductase
MAELRVHNFAMSIDGYAAGPGQSVDAPLGIGGTRLHEWIFETRTGRAMIGRSGGETGVDDNFVARGFEGIGATLMGRNMFGPVRGPWGEERWNGWWGDTPPFRHPVVVLTHHPRPPLVMDNGTTFHFVDEPVDTAVERAFTLAGGADVRLGGGVSVVQECLRARLVDLLHVPVVPVLLRAGERLFAGLDGVDGYECTAFVPSGRVAHVVLERT